MARSTFSFELFAASRSTATRACPARSTGSLPSCGLCLGAKASTSGWVSGRSVILNPQLMDDTILNESSVPRPWQESRLPGGMVAIGNGCQGVTRSPLENSPFHICRGLEGRGSVNISPRMWARPALGRLLLLGVGIHRRRALSRLGGFGAGTRRRSVSRRRLERARLDIDRATRPVEIVGPTGRRRGRLALREGPGDGCVGGGSGNGATAAEQFFRGSGRDRERHHRSSFRPLGGRTLLGFCCLRARIDRNRQRDRNALVADDALDFAFHIVRKLARAELGEIDAIAGAQTADLAFVIWTLRRIAPRLVDEAVPNVGVDDARLFGPAAIELVKVGRILARLCVALRSETNPDHRNTGAFERRNGGVDALDVGELPLFRAEFPGAVSRLAYLFRRHVGIAFYRLTRLLFEVRSHWRAWCSSRRSRRRVRLRRATGRRWRRNLLANRLTIVASDHHHDDLRLLCSDNLARRLRPVDIAARVIADEAGIRAMLAHDADIGIVGVCIFKPVGEPVRVRISHDHDFDSGILARRGCRCARVIGGLLPLRFPRPFSLPRIARGLAIAPIAGATPKAAAEGIVELMTLLLTATPWISPVLRVGRKQKSKTDETDGDRSDEHENGASRQSAKAKKDLLLSDTHFGRSRGAGLST